MPRQTLPVTSAPGAYSGASAVVTFTAANTTDKEQFALTGKELILINNTGGGAATWTATSVADPYGRVGNIAAESIAAGAIRVFGPVKVEGWSQTDGKFYLEASANTVKFAVIVLP
jgi:hypothetical protein